MNVQIKTVLLLGILSLMIVVIGSLIGGRGGVYSAFLFSLLMNGAAYFFSDRVALASSKAKEVSQEEAPDFYAMVSELSKKAGLPMPKLYITPDDQANAFATGRNPAHASVAATRGLLERLNRNEVEAVIAHELCHIKNRDILIVTIAAVLASTVAFLSRISIYSDSDNRRGGGSLQFVLFILGPIAGLLVQLAISRQREFEADADGARLIGNGETLANALLNIAETTQQAPIDINPAFSSLYIENPFGGFGGTMLKLFSTHPPLEERIERLREMSFS